MNNDVDTETLRKNLQLQLTELELLQSMFPKEFKYEEGTSESDLQRYLNEDISDPPPFVDFIMQMKSLDNLTFQLCITFPNDYPDTRPDIYIRNAELNRFQASEINRDCETYVKTLEPGEPCVYSVILWMQDKVEQYKVNKTSSEETEPPVGVEKDVRFWIYSHHIYSKAKRREILDLANELNVTGFCLPGKPGIICAEGHESDCKQWWSAIKNMTWQKIVRKLKEDAKIRRFTTFEELPFQAPGARSNCSDLSELFKYLVQHELEYAFKSLFGIEGRKETS